MTIRGSKDFPSTQSGSELWPLKRLSTLIASLEAGVSVNGSDRPAESGEYGVLKISAVTSGFFRPEENKALTDNEQQRAKISPCAGRILISRANTTELVGASARVHADFPNLFLPDKLWQVTTVGDDVVDSDWLAGLLASPRVRSQISARATGTGAGMKNVSQKSLLAIKVPVPTVDVQRKISSVIACWDRSIGQGNRLLELKERRKRGLMQQLLTGQQRFPGFAQSKGTQDTLLGLIAVDWHLKPINRVFERVRRKNGTSTDRVLTASGQHGLVDQRDYFDRNVAGVSLEGYYLLDRGEFAYNRSAMKGYPYGAIKRLDAHDCGAVSTLYHCFRLKDKESDSDFFMHLFEFGLLNRQLRRICQVGGRAHGLLNVTAGDFEKMVVPVPSKGEQKRIAAVLNECDEELEKLKAQLEAFRKQKKGLMQQLLTGKVRVPLNTQGAS